MPRKLPWGSTKSCPSPPPKRQRTTHAAPTPPTPIPSVSVSTPKKKASTSDDTGADNDTPTYMIPSDEHYIMVEDEFLTIAQSYTRSVHRAEYERLQSLAKTKNASRITEIQRPVAGVTRMSREMLARRRAKEDVLKGLPPVRDGSERSSDDEESAMRRVWGRSSLGDLLCSPKKRERDLSARWKIAPGTRAAAGFDKAEVDGGARRRLAARLQQVEDAKTGAQRKPPPVKQEPAPKHEATASDTTSSSESDDDDLDAPIRASQSSSQSQLTNSRPASQASSISANPRSIPPPPPHSIPPPSSRSNTLPSRSYSQPLPSLTRHPTAPLPRPHSSQPAPSSSPPLPAAKKPPPDFDFDFGLGAAQRSSYRGRSMAARKQAERQAASPQRERKRDGLLGKLFPVVE